MAAPMQDPPPVDVYLSNLDTQPADHQGAQGRVEALTNGQSRHFTHASSFNAARLELEPRNGFTSLSQAVRDLSGVPIASPDWSGGEVIDSLGDQLVNIGNHVPRVYNGYDGWTEYVGTQVVANKLREDSLIGGYGIAWTPDQCTLGHVQAVTYTLHPSDDTWEIWLGFREAPAATSDDNRRGDDLRGPWIVTPFRVGSSPLRTTAHVRTDGSIFWVVWNKDDAPFDPTFNVYLYATTGRFITSGTFAKIDPTETPGYWDLVLDPRIDPDSGLGLVHVQPAGDTIDPTVDVNVHFTRMWYDGALHFVGATDATISCNSFCNWMENRRPDNLLYLETIGPGGEANRVARAWQITSLAQTDSWGIDDLTQPVDAMTGFVTGGTGTVELYPQIGTLEVSSVTGPQYNPQQRSILTYHINAGGSLIRTSHEQALVSKTFQLGPDETCATFYQSGSGLNSGAGAIVPDPTAGDYFAGSQKQTVKVSTGGGMSGPNQTFIVPTASSYPFPVFVTDADTGAIVPGDSVEYILAPAGLPFLAEGTPCLQWSIASLSGHTTVFGGQLKITASDVPLANHIWDIYGPNGGSGYLTPTVNTVGGDLGSLSAPVPFTTGTGDLTSMTLYNIPDLGTKYDAGTVDTLVSSDIVISSNPTSANNGTFAIVRAFIGDPAATLYARLPGVWVTTVSQSASGSGFTAVTDLNNPNLWGFGSGNSFSDALIGGNLIVTDDVQFPENNSKLGYQITAVSGAQLTTDSGDAGTTRSQLFVSPFPTVHVELPASLPPFTFFVQALAADLAVNAYRFIGATLQLSSDRTDLPQLGLYRVIGFGPLLDGTLYCERFVQTDDLPALDLLVDHEQVTIFLPVATQAPFQPTYFLTPAIGTRPTVGMFDRLSAYGNWRENGKNLMNGHLTHVDTLDVGGYAFVAPTTQQRTIETNEVGQQIQLSTVGIKAWTIRPEYAVPVNSLIGGTQAVMFEGDSFPEDGFALAPEAPWLVSVEETAAGTVGLQPGGTYVITIVWESKDSQGRLVSSPPSPPLVVGPLAGANNKINIGFVLPFPLDSAGAPLSGHTGITNRRPLALSVYTTSYRNGLTTQTQYKVTDDLKPNAIAPITTTNESGFTFDGSVVAEYADANQDLLIQSNQPLYSVTALPRFGAPAFTDGEHWNDRDWVLDSAGNAWFSTPTTDGQRASWFPGWKIAPPPGDRPVVIRAMQQFLVAVGEKKSYYLPATQLPSAALVEIGQTSIPSWIDLPSTNGCTGQAITTPAGVFYASTASGIWNDTRGLTNDYVSQPLVDQFKAMEGAGRKVDGLAIDRDQRMIVATGTTPFVYDFVSGLWSVWELPDDVSQVCTYAGRFVARMGEFIVKQSDFALDHIDGVDSGVDWSFRGAGLSFGGTRAFQRLRRLQVIGNYKGSHKMQVRFDYPDDFPGDPTICPVLTPDGSKPYLIEAMPGHGRSSQFVVTVSITHDMETGYGESCTVELFSCKIGLAQGQRQVTPGQRA